MPRVRFMQAVQVTRVAGVRLRAHVVQAAKVQGGQGEGFNNGSSSYRANIWCGIDRICPTLQLTIYQYRHLGPKRVFAQQPASTPGGLK